MALSLGCILFAAALIFCHTDASFNGYGLTDIIYIQYTICMCVCTG